MDRIQRSRDEAARLRGQAVSEVTPSRRDFAQYVAAGKDEPAIIARLSRAAGVERGALVAQAVACDDAEVAAISLSLFDDLLAEDLAAASAAVTAPILREDPLLDANQVYHSRLHGVDAIVLPAAVLEVDELLRLVDVTVSTHMSVVIECTTAEHIVTALRWPYAIIGVTDLASQHHLAERLPATRTIVRLSSISTSQEYEAARGVCDAVIIGADVIGGDDVSAALRRLRGTD
jgi:indole-3-glycerol phosphate synthase